LPTARSSVARIARRNKNPTASSSPQPEWLLSTPSQLQAGSTAVVGDSGTQETSPATTDLASTQNAEPVTTSTSTAVTASSNVNDDAFDEAYDSNYYSDEYDYFGEPIKSAGTDRQTQPSATTQEMLTTVASAASEDAADANGWNDDDVWNLIVDGDEAQDKVTSSTSPATGSAADGWTNVDDGIGSVDDDIASELQEQDEFYDELESEVQDTSKSDVEQWPLENIDSRTDETPTAGLEDGDNQGFNDDRAKLTAILLQPSENSFLQSSAVVLSVLSIVGVICLMLVVAGCRRACNGDRPRYVPLRDDSHTKGVDFPTNYLVSQSSSGYRTT
jgi:hypothetical protein